jgi:hypothetical protein
MINNYILRSSRGSGKRDSMLKLSVDLSSDKSIVHRNIYINGCYAGLFTGTEYYVEILPAIGTPIKINIAPGADKRTKKQTMIDALMELDWSWRS